MHLTVLEVDTYSSNLGMAAYMKSDSTKRVQSKQTRRGEPQKFLDNGAYQTAT